MGLDVDPQRWPQIHHCYQQQVAQQQTTFPPVVLVPAETGCSSSEVTQKHVYAAAGFLAELHVACDAP